MRKLEPERLVKLFQEQFHIPVEHVKARDRFLSMIGGITDPEKSAARLVTNSSVYLKKHLSVSVRSITWLREPFTQT
jgi:GMP synthase PP-ATPase subunit